MPAVPRVRNPGLDGSQELMLSAVTCRHMGHKTGWVRSGGEHRVAPRKPGSSPGLARASLLTPFLQEKVKMDKNVWCLRMSLCPRPQREETLNQNNKGPCAENRVVTNSPGGTEASRTSAIAELMSAPLQATLLGHTPTAGSISAKKRRLWGEVSEQFKTEGG